MKILHVAVVLLLLQAAFATELDTEADKPRRRRGPRRLSSNFSIKPLTWGNAKVVVVPKCDGRAYETVEAHAAKCRGIVPPTLPSVPAAKPVITMVGPPLKIQPTAAPVRPMLQATAGGQQSAACTARRGVCKSRAQCTGGNVVVTGLCPGPADWTCCTPKGSTPAPTSGGSCLAGFSGARLAQYALQYQQNYASRGTRYSQQSRQFGLNVAYADCSSFTYSVMNAAGYGCLFANKAYTAAMKPLMAARGGYHQAPRTGDLAMWGGHVGIVVQACAGGKVDMVAMGNSGCRRTGCITVASLKGWGSGGWLGFWTPRP